MVYGRGYKILKNFEEYTNQDLFEKELIELCDKYRAVLFDEKNVQMNNGATK